MVFLIDFFLKKLILKTKFSDDKKACKIMCLSKDYFWDWLKVILLTGWSSNIEYGKIRKTPFGTGKKLLLIAE